MSIDGPKKEERRRFIEGEGWLVEEVEVGNPLATGQVKNPKAPREPATPVVLVAADVSLDIARQVAEQNGMIVVPASYLTADQLEELNVSIAPEPVKTIPGPKIMTEKEAIKRIKAVLTFEELNEVTATESRTAVLAAAEEKAGELKQSGAR
jgi:hypothetical protein